MRRSVSTAAVNGEVGRQPLVQLADEQSKPAPPVGLITIPANAPNSKRRRSATPVRREARPLTDDKQERLTELAQQVARAHVEFGSLLLATAARGLEIGRKAIEAKRIAGHGHFGAWKKSLCDEYGISDRSVERYMYLAKHRRQLLAALNVHPDQSDELPVDSTETLLTGLKIQDALKLLKHSSATPAKRSSQRGQLKSLSNVLSIPTEVLEIARELFGHIDLVVTEAAREDAERLQTLAATPADAIGSAPWEGQVLIHAAGDGLPELVTRTLEEFAAGHITAALFLAPAVTDDPALLTLHEFPRAFFRSRLVFPDAAGGAVIAGTPHILILLDADDRVHEFALAAGGHADLYVAYQI